MPLRAQWSEEAEKSLIDILVNEVRRGKRAENGFKKDSWTLATNVLNEKYGLGLSLTQVKNKINMIKKKYDVFLALKNNSGFGWDGENQMPTAPIDVWARYLNAHPTAREFSEKPLKNFLELEELFSGVRATGEYAVTASNIVRSLSSSADDSSLFIKQERKRSFEPEDLQSGFRLEHTISQPVSSQEQSQQITKISRRDRSSAGQEVAKALLELNNTAQMQVAQQTPIQKAIIVLQDTYTDKFTIDDMILAMTIFEQPVKSEMFLAMREGNLRDSWLEMELSKVRT